MNTTHKKILPFLDEQGRLRLWPAKREKQLLVLAHLSQSFERDRDYTEREVNSVLEERHTFGDLFLLRRELVEAGLLCRTTDGSRYWRSPLQTETGQ